MKSKKKVVYELLHRNKFLTMNAVSIDDIINGLESAALTLRGLKDTGKVKYSHGAEDDYATFITTDKSVADQYGFEVQFDE